MRVHFIAIGGAVMHNLAIALHLKGYLVTGSDDEIFEPSRGRLDRYGLLPQKPGWDPGKVTGELDTVILGMHAREDNPELQKARELQKQQESSPDGPTGLRILSFPEFLYEQTKDKKRIVIGGSHGKTTITSMIMHVLKYHGIRFDYMVGSLVDGFETMVGLSKNSEIAVFEGDEYLTSALDHRPKFHLYKPHIGLISGIAWDHMNVFPTEENYIDQFRIFIEKNEVGGSLIYSAEDPKVRELVKSSDRLLDYIPYREHPSENLDGQTFLLDNGNRYPVGVFGRHNMQNIRGAMTVCELLGIDHQSFYKAIGSFTGAGKRMQKLGEKGSTAVFLDFAHAPSKVKATTEALKSQYPDRQLTAVLELHTFSSLNAEFLPHYKGALDAADRAIVYFNPKTVEHKKLAPISKDQVIDAFQKDGLLVYTDSDKLINYLAAEDWPGSNLLIMTSGNFDGQDLEALASRLLF
jgi:UDP-N-acetylmuramate: L-alanyl-gamma-D-glutamyl-meso-diaminopimelate ligase